MKNFFTRYKRDFILLLIVFAVALVLMFILQMTKKTGAIAEISVNGELIDTLRLSEDTEKVYEGADESFNKVIVRNGEVYVAEADCRDHLCMKQGKKSKSGETIICLPHRFVVTVRKSGEGNE